MVEVAKLGLDAAPFTAWCVTFTLAFVISVGFVMWGGWIPSREGLSENRDLIIMGLVLFGFFGFIGYQGFVLGAVEDAELAATLDEVERVYGVEFPAHVEARDVIPVEDGYLTFNRVSTVDGALLDSVKVVREGDAITVSSLTEGKFVELSPWGSAF